MVEHGEVGKIILDVNHPSCSKVYKNKHLRAVKENELNKDVTCDSNIYYYHNSYRYVFYICCGKTINKRKLKVLLIPFLYTDPPALSILS